MACERQVKLAGELKHYISLGVFNKTMIPVALVGYEIVIFFCILCVASYYVMHLLRHDALMKIEKGIVYYSKNENNTFTANSLYNGHLRDHYLVFVIEKFRSTGSYFQLFFIRWDSNSYL